MAPFSCVDSFMCWENPNSNKESKRKESELKPEEREFQQMEGALKSPHKIVFSVVYSFMIRMNFLVEFKGELGGLYTQIRRIFWFDKSKSTMVMSVPKFEIDAIIFELSAEEISKAVPPPLAL